jgi:glycosyltransferase involved in cell wall biosynthesis
MNIVFYSITPLRYFKEATTLTILGLAKGLKRKGHQVTIITEKVKGAPEFENHNGIFIYRLNKGKLFFPLTLNRIKRDVGKIDIIHCFSATPLFVLNGFFSKLITSNTKIFHSLKSYPRDNFSKYFYWLLHLADTVTVPTEIFAKKLSLGNVKVLRSPINLRKFYPKDKKELRKKYGLSGKIVFYYGAFHEHKGVNNLINTIPHLKDVKFIFAPRYANIPKERALVKKLGVANQVEFITKNIPIEDYVNLADVLVLPYNSLISTEGNPSCMLEAMACKTPVITSSLPELKETFENLVVMTKPGDVKELAEKIEFVLENKNKKMIEAAYLESQKFSVAKVADRLLKLYKN